MPNTTGTETCRFPRLNTQAGAADDLETAVCRESREDRFNAQRSGTIQGDGVTEIAGGVADIETYAKRLDYLFAFVLSPTRCAAIMLS